MNIKLFKGKMLRVGGDPPSIEIYVEDSTQNVDITFYNVGKAQEIIRDASILLYKEVTLMLTQDVPGDELREPENAI